MTDPDNISTIHAEVSVSPENEVDSMLVHGRQFLVALTKRLIGRGLVVRIDAADSDYRSWQWPLQAATQDEATEVLDAIPPESSDDGRGVYPVSIWLFDRRQQMDARTLIDEFRREPTSADLAARLLNSGIARASLYRSTLDISCSRDRCAQFEGDIELAAREIGWSAQWI